MRKFPGRGGRGDVAAFEDAFQVLRAGLSAALFDQSQRQRG